MSRPGSADARRGQSARSSPVSDKHREPPVSPSRWSSSQGLFRQSSSIPAKLAKMPRKWKYVAAAVVAAHVVIALILAMGSKRTALLGGVRMSALSNMSRADAWNPQWGKPETGAEAESQRQWREGEGRKGKPTGEILQLRRPFPKSAWWDTTARLRSAFGLSSGSDPKSTTSHPEVLVDKCADVLSIPKVAMMFLTRGDLPLEPVWERWFARAEGLLPASALRVGGCSAGALGRLRGACGAAGGPVNSPIRRQHLFNVYIHVGANDANFTGFPEGSIWWGHDIVDRVHVDWGSFSLVAALKNLLRTGLEDRLNQKFILLSESGVPIYPPEVLWLELMVEEKSRINACELWDGRMDNMYHRWTPEMETETLKMQHWRKSSQWAALRRDHARIIADDTEVAAQFTKHCYMEWTNEVWRDCYSDEQYLGTLLASKGLDNQTDCLGYLTYTSWIWGQAHPQAFAPEDIVPDRIREMRQPGAGCNAAAAIVTGVAQFVAVGDLTTAVCAQQPIDYSYSLGYHCPMIARKFPKESAQALLRVLGDCRNQLNVLSGPKCNDALT